MRAGIGIWIALLCLGCHGSSKSVGNTTRRDAPAAINLPPPVLPNQLFTYKWQLTTLQGKEISANQAPYLQFRQGTSLQISGFTGCNQISAAVQFAGADGIRFSQMIQTEKACLEKNDEADFLKLLLEANQWMMNDRQLLLNKGGAWVGTFKGIDP